MFAIHSMSAASSSFLRNGRARLVFSPKVPQSRLWKRVSRRVEIHAKTAGVDVQRAGEKKGFVEEMRFVAMRLHTKDQAPKEGGQKAAKKPFSSWQPSREGYLAFLVESQVVFQALEQIMQQHQHPEYERFSATGLERSAALQRDIEWMAQQYGLTVPQAAEDGPGQTYARLLTELAESDPPAFICHFYNVYFAHSAGGRMIGSKVSSMVLDGAELSFYKYEDDLPKLLEQVRGHINALAAGWSREDKDHCLEETEKSFQYSGQLLRLIMQDSSA